MDNYDSIIHNSWSAHNIFYTKGGKYIRFSVTTPTGSKFNAKIRNNESILEYLKERERVAADAAKNYFDSRTEEQREDEANIFTGTTISATASNTYVPYTKDEWEKVVSQFANQESEYAERITEAFDTLRDMVLAKNEAYGDSVFQDIELFGYSIDAKTACISRISDKIKRLETLGMSDTSESTIDDLIGYLVALKLIIEDEKNFDLEE